MTTDKHPHYFVLTDQMNWGRGETEKEAMREARYKQSRDTAHLYLLSNLPEKWSINPWGQLSWSDDCDLISLWQINKGSGKREQLYPTNSTTNRKG